MMKPKPRSENQLLPFSTIEAATQGDPAALSSVLDHFQGYIGALATRILFDEHGTPCKCVDPELKRCLETKLIVRILRFKIA